MKHNYSIFTSTKNSDRKETSPLFSDDSLAMTFMVSVYWLAGRILGAVHVWPLWVSRGHLYAWWGWVGVDLQPDSQSRSSETIGGGR
jgi:hypothetical protein